MLRLQRIRSKIECYNNSSWCMMNKTAEPCEWNNTTLILRIEQVTKLTSEELLKSERALKGLFFSELRSQDQLFCVHDVDKSTLIRTVF